MVEINVTLQHINPGEIRNMFSGLGYNFVLTSESTRLFDVCNAFIDARRRWSVSDDIRMGTDTVVFRLIRKGAITQVPKLERDEMMEFIAKITSAMSSVPKLNILHELSASQKFGATVSSLEMATGISNQTLRRHLRTLVECRLAFRSRVGQTDVFEAARPRFDAVMELWQNLLDIR